MTDTALPALPPIGRLLGDGLRHWLAHQGSFWKITALAALILAAMPYFLLRGWIPEVSLWVQSGVRAFIDILILYQWFNYALYDDWKVRRGRLLKQKKFPWGAFLSIGFVAFWALHFFISYGVLSVLGVRAATVPLKEVLLAAAFGGFMLYLPAKVANLPWGPVAAFREAAGLKVRLILVTVLWAFVSLAALRVIDALSAYAENMAIAGGTTEGRILIIDFISGIAGIATDFLAYYVLAYIVARLFVARTGWTPEPLPAPAA